MKLHTDKVTDPDIDAAARAARERTGSWVYIERLTRRGSRSHDHAYDVILTSDGRLTRRRTMGNEGFTATWEQWGWFLSHLYSVDANMKAGPYADAGDFHHKTEGKYRNLTLVKEA